MQFKALFDQLPTRKSGLGGLFSKQMFLVMKLTFYF